MACWKIRFDNKKEFSKLNKYTQQLIENYLTGKVLVLNHPKMLGSALTGNKRGYWRYRVGKFRIICEILENELVVLIIKVAKRDAVYE